MRKYTNEKVEDGAMIKYINSVSLICILTKLTVMKRLVIRFEEGLELDPGAPNGNFRKISVRKTI